MVFPGVQALLQLLPTQLPHPIGVAGFAGLAEQQAHRVEGPSARLRTGDVSFQSGQIGDAACGFLSASFLKTAPKRWPQKEPPSTQADRDISNWLLGAPEGGTY